MLVYVASGFYGEVKHYYTDRDSALDAIKVLNEIHELPEGDSDRFTLETINVQEGGVIHQSISSISIQKATDEYYELKEILGEHLDRETYVQYPERRILHPTNDALRLGVTATRSTEENSYWVVTVSGFESEEVQQKAATILEALNTTGQLPENIK